ncbi:histidine phosphatase family protein [Rhodococcus pseudokoreensis]|uniref:Histidine phosphatase family protein n=1 Tax=Rhodococcus pseudokoreensis TaxID=2811421 RepID=A0A974W6C7_9NOCA|nr:histidine phosphatase family protein [Rhodococcus pseudokoreensis]QSE92108.1 histidine phosphatase family protein [Rhodococcus pseudokoreensis]
MELLLIRHGEPDLASATLHDPELTSLGVEQAGLLGTYLVDEDIAAVYTSPLRRAAQTAEIIGSILGHTPVVRDDLAEFDRDAPEYLDFAKLAADGDPRYAAFTRGDLSPWGTDLETFRRRVTIEFDRIVEDHHGQRVAVVSHGGVANCHLGPILGADRLSIHKPAHTGFARVLADSSGRRELISMNETSHLRPLRLSPRHAVLPTNS